MNMNPNGGPFASNRFPDLLQPEECFTGSASQTESQIGQTIKEQHESHPFWGGKIRKDDITDCLACACKDNIYTETHSHYVSLPRFNRFSINFCCM